MHLVTDVLRCSRLMRQSQLGSSSSCSTPEPVAFHSSCTAFVALQGPRSIVSDRRRPPLQTVKRISATSTLAFVCTLQILFAFYEDCEIVFERFWFLFTFFDGLLDIARLTRPWHASTNLAVERKLTSTFCRERGSANMKLLSC